MIATSFGIGKAFVDAFDGSPVDTGAEVFRSEAYFLEVLEESRTTYTSASESGFALTSGSETNGDDLIVGTADDDRIDGMAGDDTIFGEGGSDTIIAGVGNDSISGGRSIDDLRDVVFAGAGDDFIDGGFGNDELRGDAGNDTISGNFGVDTIIGGAGDDELTGSAFSDLIFGGDGADFINGGFGFDRVNGGTGGDRFFHIGILDHGSDWIQDYSSAEGDVLLYGAAASAADFQVNLANTEDAGSAAVDEGFVIYVPTGQILWALVDGAAQTSIIVTAGGSSFDILA